MTPFDSVQFCCFFFFFDLLFVTGMMEGDTKLSLQAKKWVQDALLDSSKRSKKIVRAQAYSLARKPSSREQFQHARWDGRRILNLAVRDGHRFLCDLLLEELKVDPNLQDSFDGIIIFPLYF